MFISHSMSAHFKSIKISFISFFSVIALLFTNADAQDQLLDGVVAVVGSDIILYSDIENQFLQYKAAGIPIEDNMKCQILEELLYQKLLLTRAKLDSVEVGDSQVESELDRRIRYFVQQVGSEKKLEEFYKKSIIEIKDEFRELIRDQLLVQKMQSSITEKATVTPAEVKQYFKSLPADSLPLIGAEVEIGQVVMIPEVGEDEKTKARERMENIRERLKDGEDFCALADFYSDDKGSAGNCGELGFLERSDLVPEFRAAAFDLKEGELSDIVESEFGFHIIELLERKGERINVRHILISPKASSTTVLNAYARLDSIGKDISAGKLRFEKAVEMYSDDERSKAVKGMMVNPQTGDTRWQIEQLEPTMYFAIEKLKIGEISSPLEMKTEDGKQAFRLLYLKSKTDPHKANLKDDYQKIQAAALAQKQNETITDWIKKQMAKTHVEVKGDYRECKYENDWLN